MNVLYLRKFVHEELWFGWEGGKEGEEVLYPIKASSTRVLLLPLLAIIDIMQRRV